MFTLVSLKEDAVPQTVGGRVPWSKGYAVGEPDRNEMVARNLSIFVCPRGHEFELPFAIDAELPQAWECPRHGVRAAAWWAMNASLPAAQQGSDGKKPTTPKTHWDHLLERRTIPELEEILAEALELVSRDRHEASPITTATKANDPGI